MEDDEKQRLLRTYPPVSYSGHGSSVGVPSTILEPPNQYKSRWRSIRVMYLTMFLSSVSFSICMSSLWPYLKLLDDSANTDFLGWVVASYSLGQLIASPVFGGWANCRGKSREPLVVSMIINVLANVLYSYLESIPSHQAFYLILSRSLVGFGAGNVAVVRSYVAGATTLKERTSAMANMSAFQAIGFIIGPVIQIAMVPIGYPGIVHLEAVHLDLYTSPAVLSAIVGVINIILLFGVFREHRVDNDEDINFSIQDSSEKSDIPEYKPDYFAVISSILLFFVILFIFAVFETIGTPLTMHMYSWTKKNATLYNGIILGVGGLISIVVFICIKILSKRVNERFILLGGFILCWLGFFVYLPWGNNYPSSQIADIGGATPVPSNVTDSNWTTSFMSTTDFIEQTTMHFTAESASTDSQKSLVPFINPFPDSSSPENQLNRTDYSGSFTKKYDTISDNTITGTSNVISTTTASHNSTPSDKESVGCPDTYKWCSYTPIVSFAQFIIGTLLIVIGYPTCNVMSYTLYSKILGPRPQGMMMGLLTASGSLARTVGPIFVSQVYNAYGPRVTFSAMLIIVFITILCYLSVLKRLVPFTFTKDIDSNTKI